MTLVTLLGTRNPTMRAMIAGMIDPARSILCLASVLVACGPGVDLGEDGTSGASTSATEQATAADGSVTGTPTSSTTADDTAGEPSAVDAHIEAWCQAWLAPQCPRPRYGSLEECIDHYTARLQPWIDAAAAGELAFDEQCGADQVASLMGESSCNGTWCSLFVGTMGVDDSCSLLEYRLASECDASTRCWQGVCQPKCVVFPVGGDCGYGFFGTCEEGSQCIRNGDTEFADGTCEPIPGPGDPCALVELPCGFDMWCDGGLCSDQFGGVDESCLDKPCDYSQAYCEMDVCVELLPDGAPCMRWWYCASQACVANECVALPDTVGAPCHQEKHCAGGLECDALLRTCREPFEAGVCDWQQWCPFDAGNNGVCDEGDGPDQCPPGADAADCGYCPEGRQGDGACDEPNVCAPGTDPDC